MTTTTTMRPRLPRVLRRALGLMRFARGRVSATAASIFLLREADRSLEGLVSEWDWTRTSFASSLDAWPSVRDALASGGISRIAAADARGGEVGWFEARGIACTICVPLRHADRAMGVMFFDFATDVALGVGDEALLADVGRRCARAFGRLPAIVSESEARWLH